MLINGMYGLGDSIYQRSFVREIQEQVFLRTTWPQIYRDLPNVFPVAGRTTLRTHRKNVDAQAASVWHAEPKSIARRIQYKNGSWSLTRKSILAAMQHCFGVKAKVFDLPEFEGPKIAGEYAIVRPVTIRREWRNEARNPLAEYVCVAARQLRALGFRVVSVADLVPGAEWSEQLPDCDEDYTHGELSLEQMLGAVRGAAIVVGGVGWIVPAAIAAGVPLITILGGMGGHNAPEKVAGAPMNLSRTRWIYPDRFCRCIDRQHHCDKKISGFEEKFSQALEELCSTRSLLTV